MRYVVLFNGVDALGQSIYNNCNCVLLLLVAAGWIVNITFAADKNVLQKDSHVFCNWYK